MRKTRELKLIRLQPLGAQHISLGERMGERDRGLGGKRGRERESQRVRRERQRETESGERARQTDRQTQILRYCVLSLSHKRQIYSTASNNRIDSNDI